MSKRAHKINSESLSAHKLLQAIYPEIGLFFKKLVFDKKGNIAKKLPYTEYEDYIDRVCKRVLAIHGTLKDLERIFIFLRHFPNTKSYKKYDINRAYYFRYHIENYCMRATSILDKTALLINDVLRLGIPPKKVKFEFIIEMEQVKKYKIYSYLKKMEKGFLGIKTTRNRIIHEKDYSDDKLAEISSITTILETPYTAEKMKENEFEKSKLYLKLCTNFYKIDLLEGIKKSNIAVCEQINDIFNVVYPLFMRIKETLNKQTS